MWSAITLVSTAVTLVAFVFAAAVMVVRFIGQRQERLIKSAPKGERSRLVERTLEFFPIETAGLTREQKYSLALEQISAKADRFKRLVLLSGLITIISGIILGIALSKRETDLSEPASSNGTQSSLEVLKSPGAALTVFYDQPEYAWVTDLEKKPFEETSPDHNQRGDVKHFLYSYTEELESGRRFQEPTDFEGLSNGCRWATATRPTISDEGRTLKFSTEVWGSPCKWKYWAKIEKWSAVGSTRESEDHLLDYGENLVIDLPLDTTFWQIRGETASGELVDVVKTDSSKHLQFVNETETPISRRLTYRLLIPD